MLAGVAVHPFQPGVVEVVLIDHGGVVVEPAIGLLRRNQPARKSTTPGRLRVLRVPPRQQFPRTVGCEELRQVPPARDAVGGRPRFGLEVEFLEQRMQLVRMRRDVVVHAFAVCLQQRSRIRVELLHLCRCVAVEAEGAHLAIVVDGGLVPADLLAIAEHFRRASLNQA